jgi:hypothetical protein
MSKKLKIKNNYRIVEVEAQKSASLASGMLAIQAGSTHVIFFPESIQWRWGAGRCRFSGRSYFGLGPLLLITWI